MSDARTLDAYRDRADQYAALPITDTQRRSLEGFLARLPPGAHILDLGCGPGVHARLMSEAGMRVIGYDPCPEFVATARRHRVDTHLCGAEDLTATAAFDAVWASFSLLHAERHQMGRHLTAIGRALTPNGLLFLGLKLGTGAGRDRLGRFYTYYSEEELVALLAQTGFEVIHTETGKETGLAGRAEPFILMTARHG
ncbi:hypothetical protein roselon_01489 [Roseibacterium elongatum DSM 19469]|uniref:Methyltransferase domain-containing protein n=1 Tax=Roseicyclus elongatus DSM 19469 TaxID=1294273 RepID=W8S136_9RHOB|nr:class I SAM-dependent methyltransferase [Roseibacterium elongatum]AHM03872.1 hypothetical protein roselon_01489 [Roseibacterium elongatum DSM 19469]